MKKINVICLLLICFSLILIIPESKSQTQISGESNYAMSLDSAIVYCRDATFGGFTDWYLPTAEQLVLFLPHGIKPQPAGVCIGTNGAVNGAGCTATLNYLWTRTPSNNCDKWITLAFTGQVETDNYANIVKIHVRCVR